MRVHTIGRTVSALSVPLLQPHSIHNEPVQRQVDGDSFPRFLGTNGNVKPRNFDVLVGGISNDHQIHIHRGVHCDGHNLSVDPLSGRFQKEQTFRANLPSQTASDRVDRRGDFLFRLFGIESFTKSRSSEFRGDGVQIGVHSDWIIVF